MNAWLQELDENEWKYFLAHERVKEDPQGFTSLLLNRGSAVAFVDPHRALYAKLKWGIAL